MEAKDFLKDKRIMIVESGIKVDLEPTLELEDLLEDYHKAKMKDLNKPTNWKSVIGLIAMVLFAFGFSGGTEWYCVLACVIGGGLMSLLT